MDEHKYMNCGTAAFNCQRCIDYQAGHADEYVAGTQRVLVDLKQISEAISSIGLDLHNLSGHVEEMRETLTNEIGPGNDNQD